MGSANKFHQLSRPRNLKLDPTLTLEIGFGGLHLMVRDLIRQESSVSG